MGKDEFLKQIVEENRELKKFINLLTKSFAYNCYNPLAEYYTISFTIKEYDKDLIELIIKHMPNILTVDEFLFEVNRLYEDK